MPVDKTTNGGVPRFIGKSGELGLGYRCGIDRFYNMVLQQSRNLGMNTPAFTELWSYDLATRSVFAYRDTHSAIKRMWYELDGVIRNQWSGASEPCRLGPVEIGEGYVEGPGGLRMRYHDILHGDGDYSYGYAGIRHKIHGGVMLENIIQFLARIVLMNAALRIEDATGQRMVLQAHDELGWIVLKTQTEAFKRTVATELVRCPSWAPGIPLAAEVKHGPTYGAAK
jgi:hypothetical protein